MIKKITFILVFFNFCAFVNAQHFSDSITPILKLKSEIDSFKVDKAFAKAQWSFCLKNIENDSLICEYKCDSALIPASSMKVITTTASLGILGENFKFKTTLSYTGSISKDSTLNGNIFINGGGDPTLGADWSGSNDSIILSHWFYKIKKAGIKRINGSIISDARFFNDSIIPSKWDSSDIGNYYGAGSSGLNFNENSYDIAFKSSKKIGDSTSIAFIKPELPDFIIKNEVKSEKKGSGDNVIIYSKPYSKSIIARGTVPINSEKFIVRGSIPDPALFTAFQLYKKLIANNIFISERYSTTRLSKINDKIKQTPIDTIFSHILKIIVKETNLRSVNLYAETLLKMCGKVKYNEGSTEKGILAIKDFYKKNDLANLVMNDGSGLSTSDRVSTNQFVEILINAKSQSYFNSFFESLPIAGESGSLKNIFKGSDAQGNIRAKSGFMSNVRSYAGYVNTKSGKQLAFSFIVNNYDCTPREMKKKFEKIMFLLVEL